MDKALLISYFVIGAVLIVIFFLIEKKKLPLSTFLPVVVA